MRATTNAVQVFGRTGYKVESGNEKPMRDAEYCQLFPEPDWVAHGEQCTQSAPRLEL